MKILNYKSALAAAAFGAAMAVSQTASAGVIGTTVDSVGGSAVGTTEFRAALGGDAVVYFIPLSGNVGDTCTYGVDCGTSSDSGDGGMTMQMFLEFAPVNTGSAYNLTIDFEDLDLAGANDPAGFLESVQVFDRDGNAITGLIDDISNPLVSGDAVTIQSAVIDLGVLNLSPAYVRLDFASSFTSTAGNSAEYLIAEINEVSVPAPAALGFLGLGLAGLGLARRRKLA